MQKISADDRLRALALFFMASEHAAKAREFELALARLLGKDRNDLDAFSDAMYGGEQWRAPFDELLKRAGFEVEAPTEAAA